MAHLQTPDNFWTTVEKSSFLYFNIGMRHPFNYQRENSRSDERAVTKWNLVFSLPPPQKKKKKRGLSKCICKLSSSRGFATLLCDSSGHNRKGWRKTKKREHVKRTEKKNYSVKRTEKKKLFFNSSAPQTLAQEKTRQGVSMPAGYLIVKTNRWFSSFIFF